MKTKTTIYNAMGIFPGKKLKGKEKYQHLYHYTSFDTFVRIWCTQQLKSGRNQICPFGGQITQSSGNDFTNSYCKTGGENGKVLSNLPEGIK